VAHQWFVRDELLETHLVFERGDQPDKTPFSLTADNLDSIPKKPIATSDCLVQEEIKNDEILLETNCIGRPHLIKVSYHPDWHVEGAEKIYLASPSFMLIYPQKNNVRLYYGPGPWDRLGQLMTLFGLFVLLLNIPLPVKKQQTAWVILAERFDFQYLRSFHFPLDPGPRARKTILVLILIVFTGAVAAGSYNVYTNEPYRGYNRSIQLKDAKQYHQARKGFRRFVKQYPLANLAQESTYYIAVTYYLEKRDQEAIRSFEEYLELYPQGRRAAEVSYHLGLVLFRSGRKDEAFSTMKRLIKMHPNSTWAGYARERLQEQGLTPSGEKLDINSSNLNEYLGRAISYFNQDRLAEAKPILLQISERFPNFKGAPQALAALALCYYKVGDCLNTIKYYRKLTERYPEHQLVTEAYFHLGLCYEKTGSRKLAKVAFRKVLEIDKDGVYGKQAAKKRL
jgi:TolA-binding protein